MFTITLLAFYYFFYSALGWLAESIYCSIGEKKWVNRGFLTGPLCPIYGTGALVFIVCLQPLKEALAPANLTWENLSVKQLAVFFAGMFLVFLAGMILADIVEFITSVIMEKLFHARWWDYSEKKFNIQGRICLQHTLYWGIAAIVFLYLVHPFFEIFTEKLFPQESPKALYIVITVILVIFVLDLINAVRNAMDVRKVMDKVKKLSESVTKAANEIRENVGVMVDEFQANAAKRTERFALWRAEMSKQMNEIFETFGSGFRGKSTEKKKINRLINGYPNLSSVAKKQMTRLEELLNEIKRRITDDDDEMY